MLRFGWFVAQRFRHGGTPKQVANYLAQQHTIDVGFWLGKLTIAPPNLVADIVDKYQDIMG